MNQVDVPPPIQNLIIEQPSRFTTAKQSLRRTLLPSIIGIVNHMMLQMTGYQGVKTKLKSSRFYSPSIITIKVSHCWNAFRIAQGEGAINRSTFQEVKEEVIQTMSQV